MPAKTCAIRIACRPAHGAAARRSIPFVPRRTRAARVRACSPPRQALPLARDSWLRGRARPDAAVFSPACAALPPAPPSHAVAVWSARTARLLARLPAVCVTKTWFVADLRSSSQR